MTMTQGHMIEQVWRAAGPYLAAEGLELDDVELVGSGGARILRIVVDAEGGVDLDRLADASDGLSRLLDAETDLDGPYRLEVSSPGLERKLRTPAHFRKSVGREVVVKAAGDGPVRTVRGHLTEAGDDSFAVEEDGETHRLRYEDVTSARTVFRWERAPKPGK